MLQINGREALRGVRKLGWYVHRQSGSHIILKHDDFPDRRLVIPQHPRTLSPHVISAILKTVDLNEEEFRRLL